MRTFRQLRLQMFLVDPRSERTPTFHAFRSSIRRVRLSRWLPSSRSRLQRRAPIALLRPMPAHHAHAQAVAHACCPSCFQLLGAAVAEWPCYSAANQSAKDFSPDWRQTKDLLGVRYPASNTRAPCPDSRTIIQNGGDQQRREKSHTSKTAFSRDLARRRKFQLCETFRTARCAAFEFIPSTAAVLAVLPQPR